MLTDATPTSSGWLTDWWAWFAVILLVRTLMLWFESP